MRLRPSGTRAAGLSRGARPSAASTRRPIQHITLAAGNITKMCTMKFL
jgi:hypothetical protein